MNARLLLCLLVFSTLACGDTGRERVSVAVSARGTAARPVVIGDVTVTLTRADVAVGPLYFCASQIGRAELCEVAIAELLETVTLGALAPLAVPVGTLDATMGNIESAIYDYGIGWLLTQSAPSASTQTLGGNSAVLEGTLTRAEQTVRFRANIAARPRVRGDLTVNAQRTAHTLQRDDEQLTLTVDANRWVDRLDVAALLALQPDASGVVTIPTDSTSYESISQGMLNRAPLGFVWN